MASPASTQPPYNWADDKESGMNGSSRQQRPQQQAPAGPRVQKQRTVNVNFNSKDDAGGKAGNGGSGNGAGRAASAAPNHHQGDGMISAIERIEFNDEKDILACAKAVNRLGRELHFILSMHAEEIQGVLSTYKGRWYTFGAQSRIKARLVAMHLKVSAEAAKALGVGALKMAHAFDRHFVKPEQEAKRKRNGQKARREFTIGGE
ncbi:hypothetical protein [Streptomyces caniscabiei]|uniref:hypothetical protein n=1 Tax=Streptomyces caniscabiei TaxID=2746961 RepID=UPI0029B566DA|nr:hypothetical protein [Streptomyces caniscabiei]MDX2948862.1 hypothetical protein [Streptomyces caniscabiei]